MATKTAVKTESVGIEVTPLQTREATFYIRGMTPFIMSRMSEKAKRQLLLPSGRKTTAERSNSLKHDPLGEFQDAPYTLDDHPDTLLATPSAAFKHGMLLAALRIPGVRKTEISQLLWVDGDLTPVWGVPNMLMSVVRSADMNKTPDIRTRCIVPEWATAIRLTYVYPVLNESSVTNLLVTAGLLSGIGDWRPQKGSGNYGQYAVVSENDPDFQRIIASGGRDRQLAAMNDPVMYDKDSGDLFEWYMGEVRTRGKGAEVTTPIALSAD